MAGGEALFSRVTSFPSDEHGQTSLCCASESLCLLPPAGLRQPRFGSPSLGTVFHQRLCVCIASWECLPFPDFIIIILIMVTAIGDL